MAILALLTDVALRVRVAEALRGWSAPAECVAQARDVRARLAAGDVRALVVAPRDASCLPTAPLVADVRRDHPSVTIVAYCTQSAGGSDDIVALVRAGAHTLVMRGADDERHAFRAALRAAEHQCTAALVHARVRDALPPAVAPLVALYLRADGVPPSVAEAAQLLGVHRKTLVNRLAAAGCPTPRALRTWCRLFVAARLLEEPGRTVESIADQLDFDSTTGLRNAFKRYTGHGASAIRAAGGLAHVLARFTAACADRRPPRDATAVRARTAVPRGVSAHAPAPHAPAPLARDGRRSADRGGVFVAAADIVARASVLVSTVWLQFAGADDVLPWAVLL